MAASQLTHSQPLTHSQSLTVTHSQSLTESATATQRRIRSPLTHSLTHSPTELSTHPFPGLLRFQHQSHPPQRERHSQSTSFPYPDTFHDVWVSVRAHCVHYGWSARSRGPLPCPRRGAVVQLSALRGAAGPHTQCGLEATQALNQSVGVAFRQCIRRSVGE